METSLLPLNTQVAGHLDDKDMAFLRSPDGYVLKPFQSRQRGDQEVQYYEDVYSRAVDSNEIVQELKSLMPKYYGTCSIQRDSTEATYMKLEDLTHRFELPCVMDVKMGFITWEMSSSAEKIAKAKQKFLPQPEVGFQLRGMRVYNNHKQEFDFYDRKYFKTFQSTADIINKGFVPFLSASGTRSNELAQAFARKLGKVEAWFRRQNRYAYICSSLLLMYDAQAFMQCSKETQTVNDAQSAIAPGLVSVTPAIDSACDVRMIDFAHVTRTERVDDNYLGGVQHLLQLFLQCGHL